jgi:VWFA-related protein
MAGYRQREVAVALRRLVRSALWRESGSVFARRRGYIAAGAALCAAAVVVAQEPTFRSEISYVQLPVRVLDARGEFVSGLTQSDFQVFEDRVPQTITAFTAVDIPVVEVDSAVPNGPLAGADAVASNEYTEVDGRVYVFVLDNKTMDAATSLRTRHLLRGFIQDHIKANDIVGIVMTGTGRGQHLTRNRRLLDEAIERFMSDASNPADHQEYRVLDVIAATAEWMGAIKGRRKALVLVTGSQLCPLIELDSAQAGSCADDLRNVLRRTMEADVSIYSIDPRGLVATSGAPAEKTESQEWYSVVARGPLDGARYLAEQSGGFALLNTNSLSAGFARIVRENSSYYLLGYYSTNGRADGKLRRNEVRLSRRGMQIVYRGGYVAPRSSDARRASVATSAGLTIREHLQELERNPLPVSTMALRAAAAPFLSAGGRSRVAIVVEMPNETLKPAEADGRYRLTVGLSIGLYDEDGKLVGGADPNIELTLPLSVGPKIVANGMRIVSRVEVPPGTYRLMVGAVQTPSGVRGSVMTEIDVPDFDSQPLALSGIAVTTNVAGRIYTARTDELLDEVLGAPPAAHREFPADSELWVYGEIYDHRSDAGDVTADVRVKSSDGTVVFETPFEPAPVQFGHLARIPLKELGPGSFVATIEARSAAPKPVSATRTVAFRVK